MTKKTQWPYVTIGIFTAVVGLALAFGAWALIMVAASGDEPVWQSRDGGWSERLPDDVPYPDDGEDGIFASDTVRGVVTSVTGTTITVGGGGKETKVIVDDSVAIIGASDVMVNDSVVIYGQFDENGVLIARYIGVHNNTNDSRRQPAWDRPPRAVNTPSA